MERLNAAYLAGAAGLLTLLALPATRWVVLNHAEALTSRSRPMGAEALGYVTRTYLPSLVREPERWKPKTPDAELGRAIAMAYQTHPQFDHWSEKYRSVREYIAKYPGDPAARAFLAIDLSPALLGATDPKTGELNLERIRGNFASRQKIAAEILQQTEAGERIEPENALFPFLGAVALRVLGKEKEALAAFHRAANGKSYEAHAFETTTDEWKAFEQTAGYRGNAVRLNALASYLLPQNSFMRPMARWAIHREGIAGRVDTLKFGSLMVHRSRIRIDIASGTSLITVGYLGPNVNELNVSMWNEAAAQAAARQFDAAGGHPDFSFTQALTQLRPLFRKDVPYSSDIEDVTPLLTMPRTDLGLAALIAAVLSVPLLALLSLVASGKDRVDRLRAGLPHLAWLGAALSTAADTRSPMYCLIGGIVLLVAAMAAPERARRYVRLFGFVWAALVLCLSWIDWPAGSTVVGLYIIAELMSNWRPQRRWVPGLLACAAVGALAFTAFVLLGDPSQPTIFAKTLALPIGVLAFAPRGAKPPRWLAPATFVLGFVLYLGAVGWELRDDRALGEMATLWTKEADAYRAQLGIPPG